ncbi:MAG: cytochrome c3 family protein [Acidobacteria bacterium]|nr:cytochrome c3 family protein [Acidobacteriota bacterium]
MAGLKLSVISIFILATAVLPSVNAQKGVTRSNLSTYRSNNCVICHSRITDPVRLSAKFYDWMNSSHERTGVTCDKCHGGNPLAKDEAAAHAGVANPSSPQSTLYQKNQPGTCGKCHQAISDAFVKSDHFKKMNGPDFSASCNTCHLHMAANVVYWPPDTARLCAACHKSDGTAPKSTDIPVKAGDVVAAFTRADEVIDWSYFLVKEGRKKRINLNAEVAELQRLEAILKNAKRSYHEFNLKESRAMADQAFLEGSKVKNRLAKRGL